MSPFDSAKGEGRPDLPFPDNPQRQPEISKPCGILRRRGRQPKQVETTQVVVALDALQADGLKTWKHHHLERKHPLDWSFASEFPALGGLMLKTVYDMSGAGAIIESGKTAQSYQTNVRPFFKWLANRNPALREQVGVTDSLLPPAVWQAYRDDLDQRVAAGLIGSKTAYQYKGSAARILQRIWHDNHDALGPGWRERSFGLDEFVDDTKQREPYSAAEARRIMDYSTALLVEAAADGTAEDPYDYVVEIACYTALSLRLGIESECLDALKVGDVRPARDGSVMHITYTKRRVRSGQRRSRTTDTSDPGPDGATIAEQIGSFRTAGGLLALMLRRASLLDKGPEDRLWLRRLSAHEFRRYTGILADRGLLCDRGGELKIDRTKFRVTYKTAKNVRSKGMLPLTADDNTPAVRARHYDGSERMKPFYEQAIEDAGLEALAYALSGAKVVALPLDSSAEAIATAAKELEVPAEQIEAALNGETDVWLSSCKNFYMSPFDAPGKPCSKAFFKCLGCGNALITRRTLPRIIRFLAHISAARHELSDLDWRLKFGETHARITKQILPRFPDGVVSEARIVAQGAEAELHIPPELLA